MAINYAEKYSSKVDERFAQASLTTNAVNTDYDFIGVKTVNVYSIPTATMNNYTMSGTSRYGTPAELQDTVQELTLTQDKSFTFTLDSLNKDQTAGAKDAGKALQRQIDEVVTPMIDIYRIATMASEAGKTATTQITSSNAYSAFLDGTNALLEASVPLAGRMAYVSPAYFKMIKLDDSFIKASDMAQDMLVKGSLGMVDGVNIIPVPTTYLPDDVYFVMTHKVATCSPMKLVEYITHDNPPGISGTLVEGRVAYDAFVLNNKADAIYVHSYTAPTGN